MIRRLKQFVFGKDVVEASVKYWQHLIALAISAAKCDGPINGKEEDAILHNFGCPQYAKDWYQQLLDTDVGPRNVEALGMTGRGYQAFYRVVRGFGSVMCADGLINEMERDWICHFTTATNMDSQVMAVAVSFYCSREERGDDSASIKRFAVVPGGQWRQVDTLSEEDLAVCTDCSQTNRLPAKGRFHTARCGKCHSYLALDEEQAGLVQSMSQR